MKYRVVGVVTGSKYLGEFEAASEERGETVPENITKVKSRVRFWLTCDNFSDRAICEAFEVLLLHCDALEERLHDQDPEK